LKVKEFSETLISQPNQAEPWMLVSLRLLNALEVRIKLKPNAYCSVLDIAGTGGVVLLRATKQVDTFGRVLTSSLNS